jgi:antitoxin (DNA-binding transcriptional repressor) of toxin-antitoxin stability system
MSDKEAMVPVIGIRQLSRETSDVIEKLIHSGEPVVITKQGQPVATLAPVDRAQVQDLVLGLAPSIREISSTTEVGVTPKKTRTLDEVSKQLAQEAAQTPEGLAALAKHSDDLAQQRADVRAELETDLDRVLAEGPAQLSEMVPSVTAAWIASTQALIEGAIQAARDSARALQEQVEKGSRSLIASGTAAKPAAPGRRPSKQDRDTTRQGGAAPTKRSNRIKVTASKAPAKHTGEDDPSKVATTRGRRSSKTSRRREASPDRQRGPSRETT